MSHSKKSKDAIIAALISEGFKFETLATSNGQRGAFVEFLSYRKGEQHAVIKVQFVGNRESFSVLLKG